MHGTHAHFAHPKRNVAVLEITPGMKVADFGAGSGAYVFAIAEHLSGSGTVYAIDIQKDLLRRIQNEASKRHIHNVNVIWADLEKYGASKIHEGTLDLVLISNLLFQIREIKTVLHEARRIIKPNGRVAVIDWSESFGGIGPAKEHVVKKEAAKTLAREMGLSFADEFSAGAHHYGLIFVPQSSGDIVAEETTHIPIRIAATDVPEQKKKRSSIPIHVQRAPRKIAVH